MGESGSYIELGISYEWLFFFITSQYKTKCANKFCCCCVGTRGPTNNLRILQIMPVAELSITNGMPSVSHENALSSVFSSDDVAKILMKRVGFD